MTTIPTNATGPTALQMLKVLDCALALDGTSQQAAADLIGSVADEFRTHSSADDQSRATAALLEELCRLLRIANHELTTEGA